MRRTSNNLVKMMRRGEGLELSCKATVNSSPAEPPERQRAIARPSIRPSIRPTGGPPARPTATGHAPDRPARLPVRAMC